MPTATESIDAAINQAESARARVMKIRSSQVRGAEQIDSLKSTVYAWFNTHRPVIAAVGSFVDLTEPDTYYTIILAATSRYAVKTTYLTALRNAKKSLVDVRTFVIMTPPKATDQSTDDLAPDFSPLAGNQEMRDILSRRWQECCKCVRAEAHLAAIVMMGGFLEALFVARANKMNDKNPLIKASSAPKDKTSGKTLDYRDWMLDSYIKVGRELNWITESAMGVADVLKEYRNYVHPEKERRHGIVLGLNDSSIFWQVTKALARQLLISASSM